MTIIYLTEYNCRRYAVTFENNGCVRVQKFEEIPDYEKNILCIKPLRTILGKSEVCEKTKVSRAYYAKSFRGDNFLLNLSEEHDKHSWV